MRLAAREKQEPDEEVQPGERDAHRKGAVLHPEEAERSPRQRGETERNVERAPPDQYRIQPQSKTYESTLKITRTTMKPATPNNRPAIPPPP